MMEEFSFLLLSNYGSGRMTELNLRAAQPTINIGSFTLAILRYELPLVKPSVSFEKLGSQVGSRRTRLSASSTTENQQRAFSTLWVWEYATLRVAPSRVIVVIRSFSLH